jgi:hypothetical protein
MQKRIVILETQIVFNVLERTLKQFYDAIPNCSNETIPPSRRKVKHAYSIGCCGNNMENFRLRRYAHDSLTSGFLNSPK